MKATFSGVRKPGGSAEGERRRKSLAHFFLFLGPVAAVVLLVFFYLVPAPARESFPLDDAWIHLVYARNLDAGYGFSYNPPAQEAGFTSPLWILLLAPGEMWAGGVVPAKLAGLVCLLLLAAAAMRLGGYWAALLVLFDPLLQFSAFSGMEVCLFAFLSLAALERALRGRAASAGLLAALALWARPEGVLVWGLVLAFGIPGQIRTPRSAAARVRGIAALALPAILAAGLWIVFCLHATGRPFPNTFYAKILVQAPKGTPLIEGLLRLLSDEGPFFPALLILPAVAAFLFPGRRRAAAALLLFFTLLTAGVFATRSMARVEAFYWERYLIPALAGLHGLLGLGLEKIWKRGRPGRWASILILGTLLSAQAFHASEKHDLYLRNCRDIARLNVAAGRWVAGHTPPGARVAVLDAGAIRYFGDRRIIDLAGLNDHLLTRPRDLPSGVDPGDAAILAAYTGAEWLILQEMYFSGRGGFEPVHAFRCPDLSLYLDPRPETLLILKKVCF